VQFSGKGAICRQFASNLQGKMPCNLQEKVQFADNLQAICRERCNLQEKVQFAGKGAICRQFAGNLQGKMTCKLQEKVQFADNLQAICRERCNLQTVCKQFAGKGAICRQFAGNLQGKMPCNLQEKVLFADSLQAICNCRERCNLQGKMQFAGKGAICRERCKLQTNKGKVQFAETFLPPNPYIRDQSSHFYQTIKCNGEGELSYLQ